MPRVLIVASNLGNEWSPATRTLQALCAEQGLHTSDYEVVSPPYANEAISLKKPNIVLALGDDAARMCVPAFVGSVGERRGYLYHGLQNRKVLVSVHPSVAATQWVPWRPLLGYDILRTKNESSSPTLIRPTRNVAVVSSVADARRAVDRIRECGKTAYDIEISDSQTLTCVGFAVSASEAYVFPETYTAYAKALLEDPAIGKVTQNGQFDIHFLATRCGIDVQGTLDDTLVGWHSCFPELAGYSTNAEGGREKRRNKKTHKSLAFFGSLFTTDEWWKDYETDTYGMFVLCGKDCCITFEVMEKLDALIDELDVRRIYRHTIALIPPVVAFQSRGLKIDNELRIQRIGQISEQIDADNERLEQLAMPLIMRMLPKLKPEQRRLFEKRSVCKCCRNASKKINACWSCAGFTKAPTKKQLKESGISLDTCKVCEGKGEFFAYSFNGLSSDQKKILLYDILHLPKRFNGGTLSTDEDALKSLLAHVA